MNIKFPSGDGLAFEQTASVEDLKEMGHVGKDILKHCNRIDMDGLNYIQCR